MPAGDQPDKETPAEAEPTTVDPMEHPDELPPSRELKDIALKSAGAAAKAQREASDLASTVGVLTTEVVSLRSEVSKAVKQDELKSSERHTRHSLQWPLIIGAVALFIMALGVVSLVRIGAANRRNGQLIINCTQAPKSTDPAEIKAKQCYIDATKNTAESIRHLECTNMLLVGVIIAPCEDVKKDLEKQGVHIVVNKPATVDPTTN
jgi:hypothetical protein